MLPKSSARKQVENSLHWHRLLKVLINSPSLAVNLGLSSRARPEHPDMAKLRKRGRRLGLCRSLDARCKTTRDIKSLIQMPRLT